MGFLCPQSHPAAGTHTTVPSAPPDKDATVATLLVAKGIAQPYPFFKVTVVLTVEHANFIHVNQEIN
jgi:hypothetical protein